MRYLCLLLLLLLLLWFWQAGHNVSTLSQAQPHQVQFDITKPAPLPSTLSPSNIPAMPKEQPRLAWVIVENGHVPQLDFILSQLPQTIAVASTNDHTPQMTTREHMLRLPPQDLAQLPHWLKKHAYQAIWLETHVPFRLTATEMTQLIRLLEKKQMGLIFNAAHANEEWFILLSNSKVAFVGQYLYIPSTASEQEIHDVVYDMHEQVGYFPTLVISEPSPMLFRYLANTLQGFSSVGISLQPLTIFFKGDSA